jgi:regulatory protein
MKPYEYSLNLLSARAYTERGLRRKLEQKEFDPAEVDAAIERLTSARLIDDEKYAEEFARQKLLNGGSSVRRVVQDLRRKGVSVELARAAVARVSENEPVDIAASVESQARKKLASMGGLDDDTKRRRLFAFLARRGFELDDIKRAVDLSFR